jgi:predicted XRE-type DNA-binding protein
MGRKIKVEQSSGNVFADIGIANPEQALAKAEIARQVNRIIKERRLSQSQAADILGIDQPRVSALSTGRLSVFSLDKMMQFASLLGNEVAISIKPSEHSGIKVTTASALEQFVLSTVALGNENIEFSVRVDRQQYEERRASIRMDSSEMVRVETDAQNELVAA